MNNQRILWFQDGLKFTTPQNKWRDIDVLTNQLITLAGNPNFEHVLIDPVEAAQRLFQQINLRNYSCIVDLSGFFKNGIQSILKDVPVISAFRLSRMRIASSPRLDGSGFLVSMGTNEVTRIKDDFDLSRPLFLDDVAWSGRTIDEAIKILQVSPESAEVGLLAINIGTFGDNKPGAFRILEDKGITVISGVEIASPEDDGFHLMDFVCFKDPETTFDIILSIQDKREAIRKGLDKKQNETEIRALLTENASLLFPNNLFTTDQVQTLQTEGRVVNTSGISRDSLFTTNPPNWLMPSFSSRTDSTKLRENRIGIIETLTAFKGIIKESDLELKQKMIEGTNARRERL